jgi:hypothetical protein
VAPESALRNIGTKVTVRPGAKVVSGTARDSFHIIDVIFSQDGGQRPDIIVADTGTYSDLVFGLVQLLGMEYRPALANLRDQRSWRTKGHGDCGLLNAVARGRILDSGAAALGRQPLACPCHLRRDEKRADCPPGSRDPQRTNDRLEQARIQARSGVGRLLTEKGTSLAEAVLLAFGHLGFQVEDLDRGAPAADGAGLAEDFKVIDPDVPTFDPLIEVKGYDRGTRATDLSQLDRQKKSRRTGRTPTAIWSVVNHWRHTLPDQREDVLASESALIDERSYQVTPLVVIDPVISSRLSRPSNSDPSGPNMCAALSLRHEVVGSHRSSSQALS